MKLGKVKIAAGATAAVAATIGGLLATLSVSLAFTWTILVVCGVVFAGSMILLREIRKSRRPSRRTDVELADVAKQLRRLDRSIGQLADATGQVRIANASTDRVTGAVADCARAVAVLSVRVDELLLESRQGLGR